MNKDVNALRNTLGALGIFLPVLSYFFNRFFGCSYNLPGVFSSISATHYSSSYLLFEGLVFSVGLFLICYRGYDVKDRVLTISSGCGAILLTLFPCSLEGAETRNFLMLAQKITNPIHLASALVFFGCLVILIGFQFTKTGEGNTIKPGSRKWRRNILYSVCSLTMAGTLVVGIGGAKILGIPYLVYIGEGLALWAFGIAWLTKGGLILKDL